MDAGDSKKSAGNEHSNMALHICQNERKSFPGNGNGQQEGEREGGNDEGQNGEEEEMRQSEAEMEGSQEEERHG